MRFYLAGPYAWQEKLSEYAEQLSNRGHTTTSHWLSSSVADNEPLDDSEKESLASNDLVDIRTADVFLAFMSGDAAHGRGGRHVEYGYALALTEFHALETIVIGETDNIFYSVEHVRRFADWESFLATVDDLNQPKLF